MCVETTTYNTMNRSSEEVSQFPLSNVEGEPLRIWHDGADAKPFGVNGVNATIWLLAGHQARLGHDVTLLLRAVPSAAAIASANASGIRLLPLGGGLWNVDKRKLMQALSEAPPDVVQMHSVFIPRQASLARHLRGARIPYITTPHGGLSPDVMRHNRFKKAIYATLFERPRCRSAAMLTAAMGEEADVRIFLGPGAAPIRNMPVGIDTEALGDSTWNQHSSPPRLVFLGRFDVYVKGIDLLLGLAGLMRDHEFHLYGVQDHATRESLRCLRRGSAANVFFHPPVYGQEKVQVLRDATMYIQMSRSESFGIAIAEAMHLGVPCAISEQIHLAGAFRKHDLGLLLPTDSAAASTQLTRALKSKDALLRWSRRAKRFADENFSATMAAQRHIELYRDVIGASEPHYAIAAVR